MELLIELVQIIGEKLAETSAKRPKTRAAEQAFKKNLQLIKHLLLTAILIASILLPAYFFYDGYASGKIGKQYFYVGLMLVVMTLISNLFTLAKTLALFRQEVNAGAMYESSTVEDDIQYEMGLLVLFTFLSAIPILNLIVTPLAIDRALNVLEITGNNPQRQKVRNLAENIAFSSLFVFLAASLAFSIVLIIVGDTKNL